MEVCMPDLVENLAVRRWWLEPKRQLEYLTRSKVSATSPSSVDMSVRLSVDCATVVQYNNLSPHSGMTGLTIGQLCLVTAPRAAGFAESWQRTAVYHHGGNFEQPGVSPMGDASGPRFCTASTGFVFQPGDASARPCLSKGLGHRSVFRPSQK